MNRFKQYLVPALTVGVMALGMDAAMANTIGTASLPADVKTAIEAAGFVELKTWIVGIVSLIAGITAAFAGARLLRRGGNAI